MCGWAAQSDDLAEPIIVVSINRIITRLLLISRILGGGGGDWVSRSFARLGNRITCSTFFS